MSRVIPVITFDREMIRMLSERLPSYPFSLQGFKLAFALLENQFRDISCNENEPCIILQFSESTLLNNYRATNDLLTDESRQGVNRDLQTVMTTLLNKHIQ